MNVIIDSAGPKLEEADNLRAFAVELKVPREAAQDLGGCGVWSADGAHLFVEPDWLRRQAGSLADDAGWQRNFAGMVEFARSKGWLDDQGRIRAHVVSA